MLEADILNNSQLAKLIEQANTRSEVVTLTQNGEQKAVLLSMAMFQSLLGISDRSEELSDDQFAAIARQLFASAGCNTREEVMDLISDVKTELSIEQELRLAAQSLL